MAELRVNRYSLVGGGDTVLGEGVYTGGGGREDLYTAETQAGDQSRVHRVA